MAIKRLPVSQSMFLFLILDVAMREIYYHAYGLHGNVVFSPKKLFPFLYADLTFTKTLDGVSFWLWGWTGSVTDITQILVDQFPVQVSAVCTPIPKGYSNNINNRCTS